MPLTRFLLLLAAVLIAGALTVALMAWSGLPSVVFAIPALVAALVLLRART